MVVEHAPEKRNGKFKAEKSKQAEMVNQKTGDSPVVKDKKTKPHPKKQNPPGNLRLQLLSFLLILDYLITPEAEVDDRDSPCQRSLNNLIIQKEKVRKISSPHLKF